MVPVFNGLVVREGQDVRLTLVDTEREARQGYLRTLIGLKVDVVVKEHKDTRGQRANAYYWKCVLGEMAEHCGHSVEEIHDAMCEKFLPNEPKRVEFFNMMTGECLTVETDGRRTSKLTGSPFYDFVEHVRQFAIEFMGVATQDPDPEYWRKRAA